MGDRRFLQDAVPEIEDVRAAVKRVKDSPHSILQSIAAGKQGQRVEIALKRHVLRKLACGPGGIDGLVEADRVNAALSRIGRELAARALWKADDWNARMPCFQCGCNPRGRSNHPLFEL